MKIAIIYPAYSQILDVYNQTIETKLYESEYFNVKSGIKTYQYEYQAELNEDGTITIENKTKPFTLNQLINFLIALILTVIIEVFSTKIYFKNKEKPNKIIRNIILINLISLSIFWFLMSYILKGTILLFIIGEILVTLIEGYLIYTFTKRSISIKSSMILSVINNVCSLVIEGIIFLIITAFLGI